MKIADRRFLAAAVFFAALIGFFSYFGTSDDHFDRLARARQIAVYGDVPFRDFFDPGYFLTLYSSALLQRLLGDNLLGEVLLDCVAMAVGTMVVFLLASRASKSTWWGLAAGALVLFTEPRHYDYDKVLFYPLGLWACWHYIDRPGVRRLLIFATVAVVAGLFRYDTSVYLTCAALITLVVVHARDWRVGVRRIAILAIAMLVIAAPALAFIEATAGLDDAFTQVRTYAAREGERTKLFRPAEFNIDWSLPLVDVDRSAGNRDIWETVTWFPGFSREENASAWLYWLAVVMPIAAALIVPLRRVNRERATMARVVSYAALGELTALLILRDPVKARIGGVMPLVVVGGGLMVAEISAAMRLDRPHTMLLVARRGVLIAAGIVPLVLTCVCLWTLAWWPPLDNLRMLNRLSRFAELPVNLDLMPKGAREPLASYIHACTKPTDRFFVPWFAADLYFFSGRGFAAGLPVVFANHWTEMPYQRRSLQLFETQSVPIILTEDDQLGQALPFLWDYIVGHYDMVRKTAIGPSPEVEIWVRRGLPVTRTYGPLGLPCFAP